MDVEVTQIYSNYLTLVIKLHMDIDMSQINSCYQATYGQDPSLYNWKIVDVKNQILGESSTAIAWPWLSKAA